MSGFTVTVLGPGYETFAGTPANDSVLGLCGNDSILGIGGNDILDGGADNDTLDGGADNDTLIGGGGHDSLVGGNGTDWASYVDAGAGVTVDLGTGRSSGADGNDSLTGIENIRGGNGADSFLGDGLANVFDGGLGNDTLIGGDGIDQASYAHATGGVTVDIANGSSAGADGNDILSGIENVFGGNGNDTIIGDSLGNGINVGGGNNLVFGGDGRDAILVSASGSNTVYGEDGDDLIQILSSGIAYLDGGEGDDELVLNGVTDNNTLIGGGGNDILHSSSNLIASFGHDSLVGGTGDDVVDYFNATSLFVGVSVNLGNAGGFQTTGGAGNDTLVSIEGVYGTFFNDTLIGDGGANTLMGRSGNDSLGGGNGSDWASYEDQGSGVTVNLVSGRATGPAGNDSLSNIENVLGGAGNDTILGSTVANFLAGGAGNDTLDGGNGNDTLDGGTGNDSLNGGADFADLVSYAGATGDVTVNLTTGRATGADGADSLTEFEQALGSAFNDSMIGALTPDSDFSFRVLDGAAGDDTLVAAQSRIQRLLGGAGNDSLVAANFASQNLNGGEGADTLVSGNQINQVLAGGLGDDSLVGGTGNGGNFSGGAGNDTLLLAGGGIGIFRGDDAAGLETGNDSFWGSSGADMAEGGLGDDTFSGRGGSDQFEAGDGNDSADGGADADFLYGDAGNDTLLGGAGDDTLDGGDGVDFASYANAAAGVDVQINADALGGAGSDELQGFEGLIGSNFNDTLQGDTIANTLYGGDGSDSLVSGGGNGGDWLDYGAGNDTFTWVQGVTTGNLTLIGGAGANDFLDLARNDWVSGIPTGNDWINFQNTIGGVTVTMFTQGWEQVVCFAEGTRIVTPSGEDVVENLRAGDMVLAMRAGQAGFEPLRWVGFMDIAVPRNATMAAKTAPILIKAGAIAPGMPARDLRVSPDHAMEIDGHLIPAKHLVNG
ncbi:MAG: Hint domain-containing protein, partial [Acetobacteraceae bacterium]